MERAGRLAKRGHERLKILDVDTTGGRAQRSVFNTVCKIDSKRRRSYHGFRRPLQAVTYVRYEPLGGITSSTSPGLGLLLALLWIVTADSLQDHGDDCLVSNSHVAMQASVRVLRSSYPRDWRVSSAAEMPTPTT